MKRLRILKKKTSVMVIGIAVLTILLLAACGDTEDAQDNKKEDAENSTNTTEKNKENDDSVTFVLAHSGSSTDPLTTVYDEFAKQVEDKSEGRIIIQVHGAHELGSSEDIVQMLDMGTIDIGSINSNAMSSYTDAYLFADLPYVFNSLDSTRKVWDSEIGDELREQIDEELGLKVLMHNATGGGFRVLANTKREIKVPSDAKGLKIRSTPSPIEQKLLKDWGTIPTEISFSETYTALQQGVVEGEHIQIGWIDNGNHEEVINYVTKVDTMSAVHIALMSDEAWDKLTPEFQDIILEAAKDAEELATELDKEMASSVEKNLEEAGVEIYEPNKEEMKLWNETGEVLWKDFEDQIPSDVIQSVIEVQEQ